MKKLGCLVILLTMVMTGCGKEEEKVIEEKVKYVITEPATVRKMNQIFKSDAVLEPKNKVDHKTEQGGTIEKILKRNGDKVKKGELVMELSDSATESAYFSAKANYNSSLSAMNIAKNNYLKFKNLYEKQLVSYLEYVGYENTYVGAKGSYEAAKASYEAAKSDYNKLFRRAEIDGVVGNLFGKVGNEIAASEVVFTVVDDTTMETYVGFPAEWLTQIQVGQGIDVEVGALNNKKYVGKILEINPIADSVTKKYMIKLGIDNKEKDIKDGMYAYVTVPVGEVNVLSVSDESIFVRNLLSYVFKIEDGVAKRVEVKTGATNLPFTEISSANLKEGDRVVVKGLFGLEEGNKVEENPEAK